MRDAIYQAALETLERAAVKQAQSIPHFFDRYQVDPCKRGWGGAPQQSSKQSIMRDSLPVFGAFHRPT